jgi:hypothetical protein
VSAKQLLRLTVLLAGLLLIWGAAALARRREGVAAPSDALRLPRVTRNGTDTVLLARPADTVVLARKDTSRWTVNGHAAGSDAIGDLFAALADTAAGSELVAQRRSSHAALGVDSATGTRVRIRGSGRTLADLVVGHRSPDLAAGYVRRADEEPTYLVHGRLAEILSRPSDEWRDHRIAAVPAESVAAIEVSRGARRYRLARAGSGWALTPGGPADSARAADLLAAYRAVDASGFASPAQADSAHFGSPDRRARLLRKGGTPLLTLVFDSTAGGFWVRADTGKSVYRIESFTADRLAPPDSALRARPAQRSGH